MARESDTEDSSDDSLSVHRRRVLQGIGGVGAGAALASGPVSAQTDSPLQTQPPTAGGTEGDVPTSTQFYTYRDTGLSVPELIREAAAAGYDAFEPFRVGAGTDVDPILAAMEETGLEMSSAHISIGAVESDTEAMATTFTQFGDPTLVDPGAGPDDWGDESAVVDFAERCNAAAEMLDEYDLEFGHHNHAREFATIGDTTGYDVFAENLDDQVRIQLDVGWALVGGRDPIAFIAEHPENVRMTHMKNMDVETESFTEIDEGDVSMRAVANTIRHAGNPTYLVYEHDEPENPLESMETGAYWLERLNQPWQPGGICAIPGADVHPAKLYSP